MRFRVTSATRLGAVLWVSLISVTGVLAQETRFDVNDVSYLWPVPTTAAEVATLVSGDDLLADGKSRVWPRAAFETIIKTAETVGVESSAGRIERITFGPLAKEFNDPHTWKVAGFRVDPCAPGCHHDLVTRFGASPQIRLILQPVTIAGTTVTVHDVAAHLVFSYTQGASAPAVPDRGAFQAIVDDLKNLKSGLEKSGVSTAGALGVHPGLKGSSTSNFSDRVKSFLKSRLAEQRLIAAAFMGLAPRPEPWVFFALRKDSDGRFVPAPHPALGGAHAQMFTLRGGDPVMPPPKPLNLSVSHGVSTSLLLRAGATGLLDGPALRELSSPLLRDVPDLVANPERANFFNTDCVSCHTETALRATMKIAPSNKDIRFSPAEGISGLDETVAPTSIWNVRNYGWFPSRGQTVATVTQRTANESAESASAINRDYLTNQESAGTTKGAPVATAVANPLTLVMKIKSPNDFKALKGLIDKIQSLPPDKNPVMVALNKIGTVHFARFVFIEERLLAVITTYDGEFDRYIDAFVDSIGEVFDQLLAHIADAPPLPVAQHRAEFLEFVKRNDLTAIPPFYSAYPDLKVLDILTLQKKAREQPQ